MDARRAPSENEKVATTRGLAGLLADRLVKGDAVYVMVNAGAPPGPNADDRPDGVTCASSGGVRNYIDERLSVLRTATRAAREELHSAQSGIVVRSVFQVNLIESAHHKGGFCNPSLEELVAFLDARHGNSSAPLESFVQSTYELDYVFYDIEQDDDKPTVRRFSEDEYPLARDHQDVALQLFTHRRALSKSCAGGPTMATPSTRRPSAAVTARSTSSMRRLLGSTTRSRRSSTTRRARRASRRCSSRSSRRSGAPSTR